MFRVLLESAARRPRRGQGTLTSILAHAALVTAAVILTTSEPRPRVGPVEIVRLALPRVFTPAPSTATVPRASAPGSLTFREIRVVVPTVAIPAAPANPSAGDVFPDSGVFREGIGPTRIVDPSYPYFGRLVDRQIVPWKGNGNPEYPHSLRAAMVEGHVLVQFVVDTTGRVEPNSFKVFVSTHPLFAESARRWLARTRYYPAQIYGRPVRQWVQQQIAFTLDR